MQADLQLRLALGLCRQGVFSLCERFCKEMKRGCTGGQRLAKNIDRLICLVSLGEKLKTYVLVGFQIRDGNERCDPCRFQQV